MHAFQSELSPATGSFTKTQYAAETPGAKVGGSVFVDLDAYQFSPNPFLDNSRVTDSPRMSFPLRPKLTRNEWLTFAIGKALSDRVADKRPRMASLNLGELLRQLKSACWKLLRFWAVDGQPGVRTGCVFRRPHDLKGQSVLHSWVEILPRKLAR